MSTPHPRQIGPCKTWLHAAALLVLMLGAAPSGADEAEWQRALNSGLAAAARGDGAGALSSLNSAMDHARAVGETDWRVAVTAHDLAEAYRLDGQYAKARQHYAMALEVFAQDFGANAGPTMAVQLGLAGLETVLGDHERAWSALEAAAGIARTAFGENAPQMFEVLNRQALFHLAREDFAQAQSTLDAAGKLTGLDATDSALLAVSRAAVARAAGDLKAANGLLKSSVAALKAIENPDHRTSQALASAYAERARSAALAADYDKAAQDLQAAIAAKEAQNSPEHPDLIPLIVELAQTRLEAGELREAESVLARAEGLASRIWPSGHVERLPLLLARSELQRRGGQFSAAADPLEEAAGIAADALHARHPARISVALASARVALDLAQWEQAAEHLDRADAFAAPSGSASESITAARAQLAALAGRSGEALALARQAYEGAALRLGAAHLATLELEFLPAQLALESGIAFAGAPKLAHAHKALKAALSAKHPQTLRAGRLIAELMARQRNFGAAIPALAASAKTAQDALGRDHAETALQLLAYGRTLGASGNSNDAAPVLAAALAAMEGAQWHSLNEIGHSLSVRVLGW